MPKYKPSYLRFHFFFLLRRNRSDVHHGYLRDRGHKTGTPMGNNTAPYDKEKVL
jgi:hypothetical protein